MKKQITIQATEDGKKYFTIYEVKAVKHDGKVVVYEREMKKEEAEKDLDDIYDIHSNLYKSGYIIEQMVWC